MGALLLALEATGLGGITEGAGCGSGSRGTYDGLLDVVEITPATHWCIKLAATDKSCQYSQVLCR